MNLAYLADLRPFAAWVETALRHGNRAGAPVRPPAVRAEARILQQPLSAPRGDELTTLVENAYRAALDHGLRSAPFRLQGQTFATAWEGVADRVKLIEPRPRHPEVDLFRLGLAHSLASLLPDESLGPTTFALLLAAIGADDPIVRTCEEETTDDAIAVRAQQYEAIWQRGARRARTAHERFIILPGRPVPLRSGQPSRLEPPFLHLASGETVAHRPAGIPSNATINVVARGKRRWFYARWRAAGRQYNVALGPAA